MILSATLGIVYALLRLALKGPEGFVAQGFSIAAPLALLAALLFIIL